jgi:hypothetical protein
MAHLARQLLGLNMNNAIDHLLHLNAHCDVCSYMSLQKKNIFQHTCVDIAAKLIVVYFEEFVCLWNLVRVCQPALNESTVHVDCKEVMLLIICHQLFTLHDTLVDNSRLQYCWCQKFVQLRDPKGCQEVILEYESCSELAMYTAMLVLGLREQDEQVVLRDFSKPCRSLE